MWHIHTDLSAQQLLEFLQREKSEDTKDLATGLLENFLPQAVEPIRQMVLGDELTPDQTDLKYHLIAACTIMGATFPEYPSTASSLRGRTLASAPCCGRSGVTPRPKRSHATLTR